MAENGADGVGSFDNVQFEVNSAVFSSKMIRQDYRELLVNGEFVVYMIKKTTGIIFQKETEGSNGKGTESFERSSYI